MSYHANFTPSLNIIFSMAVRPRRIRLFSSFSKALSRKLNSPERSSSLFRASSTHSSKTNSRRIVWFAVSREKFASSSVSPASAHVSLVASAVNWSTHCFTVRKLPLDLDIFSASTITWPLAKKLRGQNSGFPFQMAAWLNKHMVRWFWIRSFPEHRRSSGYQNLNSFLISSRYSGLMLHCGTSSDKQKMKSHTSSPDRSSGLIPKGPGLSP
mmetsp:Transcript_19928/g.48506  ORF Transcript_19928/g.48506 Transcript_19928/m.48506 type:complete len:212 (+) Transcript_19928:955-1590(+)